LFDHLHVDGDIDIVTDHDAAAIEVGIPLHAEVLAVDLGCGSGAAAHVPKGRLSRFADANFFQQVRKNLQTRWRKVPELALMEVVNRLIEGF
jgi:hypothetical protein